MITAYNHDASGLRPFEVEPVDVERNGIGTVTLWSIAWHKYRRRLVMVMVTCAASVASLAASVQDVAQASGGAWHWEALITPSNVFAALVMVFHFGSLRQQLKADKEALEKLKERFDKFVDDRLPQEYLQQKLAQEQFSSVRARLEALERDRQHS